MNIKQVIDLLLTVAFFCCVASNLYILRDDPYYLAQFIGYTLIMPVFSWVMKALFFAIGRFVSGKILNKAPFNDPLKDEVNMRKWTDQSWQLAIHFSLAFIEFGILYNETWYHDTMTMWTDKHPRDQEHGENLRFIYLFQLGVWTWTAFSCKFLEEKRKDYFVMYFHHIVTIIMLLGSWAGGYLRIGLMVLFVHDTSDITVDLLKMTNYLKLEGKAGFFITEFMFVFNLCHWIYWRLYVYPSKVIYTGAIETLMALEADVPYYFICVPLLVALLCLHIWWTFLFFNLAYKIATTGEANKAGVEEYEGEFTLDDKGNKMKKKKQN